MPLKIHYVNGPYAGRDIEIDDAHGEVRFGRGLDADIPFPEDLTQVSHQHFGLRKEYGGYKFIINREKPVFLNGRPVYDGQDLPRTAELQISSPTGPRLRIERVDAYGPNQAKTEILAPTETVSDAVRKGRSRNALTTGSLLAIAIVVAAIAGAGYWLFKGTQDQVATTTQLAQQTQGAVQQAQSDIASMRSDIPSLKAQVAGLSQSYDFSAIIDRAKGSIYQIAVELPSGTLNAMGTAWIVAMPDGTKALATNAHIAALFDEAKTPKMGGGRLIAIEPKGPVFRHFVITSVKQHPGYDAWGAFASDVATKANAGVVRAISLPIAYDVGLLFVDHPENLGAPLPIATESELESIRAGDRILDLGYPSENVIGADVARPEPTSNSGMVMAMTTFLLASGQAADRQFIQHSAAGAGGSSGSAILNTKGEVIGLHNAGNYIFVKTGSGSNDYERLPAAGNMNYGQRVDLLRELVEGTADERLADIYRPMWATGEKQLEKSADAIIEDQVTILGASVGGADKVSPFQTIDGEMTVPDPLLPQHRAYSFDVDPPTGKTYLFLAQSEDQRPIALALYRKTDGSQFGIGTRGTFFSSYTVTYDAAMPAHIVIFEDNAATTPDDKRPPGKVKLSIYQAPIVRPDN